jgi:hypothetical protein
MHQREPDGVRMIEEDGGSVAAAIISRVRLINSGSIW